MDQIEPKLTNYGNIWLFYEFIEDLIYEYSTFLFNKRLKNTWFFDWKVQKRQLPKFPDFFQNLDFSVILTL